MAIGDIKITTLSVGDIDLTSYKQASYSGFNIYEDILNPYGPSCDIRVIDHSDAMGSTRSVNGSYDKDIKISFTTDQGGEPLNFSFKQYKNKNQRQCAGFWLLLSCA